MIAEKNFICVSVNGPGPSLFPAVQYSTAVVGTALESMYVTGLLWFLAFIVH